MTSIKNTAEHQYLNNFDNFISELIDQDFVLEIEYESDTVRENALFCIKLNHVVIKEFKLKKEKNKLVLNLSTNNTKQVLEFSMIGKGTNETLVKDGNILKDTFLKLLDLKINNYQLLSDYDFYSNQTEYYKHASKEQVRPMDGFWEDATLKITFDFPFELWYNNISTKNAVISESLKFRTASKLDASIEDLEESLKKLV